MANTQRNKALPELQVQPIALARAKVLSERHHYMGTAPKGAVVSFGLFHKKVLRGFFTFGHAATTTNKVARVLDQAGIAETLEKKSFLEMQRMWIDDVLGHNTESFALSRVMEHLRTLGVRLVVTHAGGCKDDVGIVYQSSGWLYFGSSPCNDFYLTTDGKYRNISSAMRFGRVKTKNAKEAAYELFGAGELLKTRRFLYVYPIAKTLRRKLTPHVVTPLPKDSAKPRYKQKWVQ